MSSLLNFIKNVVIGSKVVTGEQMDKQDGDFISLTFVFGK
jgi:hypothetical protein